MGSGERGVDDLGPALKRAAWCVCLRLLSLACHRLPSDAVRPRLGPRIKHEFRLMVRRDGAGMRLRNGHDWSDRFPLIAEAAGALKARSFLVDGEAVACDREPAVL
jgi:hypothetical protein